MISNSELTYAKNRFQRFYLFQRYDNSNMTSILSSIILVLVIDIDIWDNFQVHYVNKIDSFFPLWILYEVKIRQTSFCNMPKIHESILEHDSPKCSSSLNAAEIRFERKKRLYKLFWNDCIEKTILFRGKKDTFDYEDKLSQSKIKMVS